MSRLSFPALALLLLAAVPGATLVSGQEPEPIKITTADAVKLHAVFYPSGKKNAPTVIMLHGVGEGKNSSAPEWKGLALALQKANYAVIRFDFRGHGDSTAIDDEKAFWGALAGKVPVNLQVKAKAKDTIDVKDFIKSPAYMPILVNDIAAVRAWLDRRNDEGKDCNTSSIIVIGADQGATLAALWMNSEWHRYKYAPPAGAPPTIIPKFVESRPEGKDIIGAVFLTVQPSIGASGSVTSMLKTACKDNGTAAAFFYGKEDVKGRDYAKTLTKTLKVKDKDGKESNKHRFIGPVELDTNLTGVKLLREGLGTEKAILDYLDTVVDDRKNDRVERDFSASPYVWRVGNAYVPAHKRTDKNFYFFDYKYFAQ